MVEVFFGSIIVYSSKDQDALLMNIFDSKSLTKAEAVSNAYKFCDREYPGYDIMNINIEDMKVWVKTEDLNKVKL